MNCLLPGYNISKIHQCGERERYARQIARIVADYPNCQYGCAKLPCVHDKFPVKEIESKRYFNQFYRPRMAMDANGVWRSEQGAPLASHDLATENRAKHRNSILSAPNSTGEQITEPNRERAANRSAGASKAEFERTALADLIAAIESNGSESISKSTVNYLGNKSIGK